MKTIASKPPAAISLDLDNLWSFMKTHGDRRWEEYPSYLDAFIPKVLGLLKQLDMKITFFIVGKDAALKKNKDLLRQLTDEGHEVANHSFLHEQWLTSYSSERIRQEIVDAETVIAEATGQKPLGFRGPGYCANRLLHNVLMDLGYLYDSSSLPTFLGPLARVYYFLTADLDKEEKDKRKELFGGFRNGLMPTKPYLLQAEDGGRLLEIPVTTIPLLKIPFHLSYLMYIAGYSEELMRLYLKFGISLCKMSRTPLNFLLHPLDLIGKDAVSELAFFPGMDISSERKTRIFLKVLRMLSEDFQLVNMSTFAQDILQNGKIKKIHN
jgi:hypothetical protein